MNFDSIRRDQKTFSILAAVVVLLFTLALFFIQQAIDSSQDLRQQASVTSGQVQVAVISPQPGQIKLGQPSYIDLSVTTNNIQTNGLQLSFELEGQNISNFSVEPISGSGLNEPLLNPNVTGNAAQIAFLPENVTSSFSTSSNTPFMRINFTPNSSGNITLSFSDQDSISTVFNSDPPQDELNTIEPIVLTIAAASPTPSPSSIPSPSPSISPTPSPSPSPVSSPVPTPSPSPSPIACSQNPDLNLDSKVDLLDYNLLSANFMSIGENITGDIDCNGKVDLADYSLLSQNFGF